MKVVTAAEMREIDRSAIEDFGIPAEVLMNSAGKYIAEFINGEFSGSAVHIICGTGNNGGDGFTAAYYLLNAGHTVKLTLCGTKERVSPVSRIFMNICEKSGILIDELTDTVQAENLKFDSGIIVDAIFGTGFSGEPSKLHSLIFKKINCSGLTVISLDMPSGLPSDGSIKNIRCVKADITVTIGLPKISIVTYPGSEFSGEVITADIGFPLSLTRSTDLKVDLFDKDMFSSAGLFTDHPDMHKGDRGHILIAGGFTGMEGAILLTAKALFRTGAGLATLLTVRESRTVIAGKIPELMTEALPDTGYSDFIKEYLLKRKFTALVIGPGMGRSESAAAFFTALLDAVPSSGIQKILIDGDGLYHLADYLMHNKLQAGPQYCITPHFMEASRISGRDLEELKYNRLQSAIDLAKHSNCVVVLKGPATIVSDGILSLINTTGNSRLATAGSGDVLTGIIASFMVRCGNISTAASCGVYMHGLCADLFAGKHPYQLMKAGDIIKTIPAALNKIYY